VNLSGADLTACRLSGGFFRETNLVRAILYEADLSNTNFMGSDLSHANLQKAILVEANLSNAKLVEASLRQADLTQADFSTSDLAKADLHFAKCSGTDFRRSVLAGANFEKAFLRGAVFRGADIRGAVFTGALGADPALLKGDAGADIELDEPAPSSTVQLPAEGFALGIAGQKVPVDYNTPRVLEAPKGAPRKTKYHPPLRGIASVIFTTGGWIRGVFNVPTMHGFLEHLNLSGEMLKLTNVILPYLNLELRFFGLRKSKAILVMPDCDPALLQLPEPTAAFHVHRVSFLVEGGSVTGSLAIEEDIRVSDYLANHDQFILLRNCRFGAHDAPVEEESHFPLLLVNCAAVVGASDERLRD
jgi:uncharacterized protein YjbI with pentapeptide repeats